MAESNTLTMVLGQLLVHAQQSLQEQKRTNELLSALLANATSRTVVRPIEPDDASDDDDDDEADEPAEETPAWVAPLMQTFAGAMGGMFSGGDGKAPSSPKE